MDQHLATFKEFCGPIWSDGIIQKMIAKHGVEMAIGMALEGRDPDVDADPARITLSEERPTLASGPTIQDTAKNGANEIPRTPAVKGGAVAAASDLHTVGNGVGYDNLTAVDLVEDDLLQPSQQSSQEAMMRNWKPPKARLEDLVLVDDDDFELPPADPVFQEKYLSKPMVSLDDDSDEGYTATREMDLSLVPKTMTKTPKHGYKAAASSPLKQEPEPSPTPTTAPAAGPDADLERMILKPVSFVLRPEIQLPATPMKPNPAAASTPKPLATSAVTTSSKKRPRSGDDSDEDMFHQAHKPGTLYAPQPIPVLNYNNSTTNTAPTATQGPNWNAYTAGDFEAGKGNPRTGQAARVPSASQQPPPQAASAPPAKYGRGRSSKNPLPVPIDAAAPPSLEPVRFAPQTTNPAAVQLDQSPNLPRAPTLVISPPRTGTTATAPVAASSALIATISAIDTDNDGMAFPNPEHRYPTEQERQYLDNLIFPAQLCDLPPHDFGRTRSLKTVVDRTMPTMEANVLHWMAMLHGFGNPDMKIKKSDADVLREVLMIVDLEFACTPTGAGVLDMLQRDRVPVTTAKLPCKNSIIWKRRGVEFDVRSVTSEHGDMETPIYPLHEYTADLDCAVLILKTDQWGAAAAQDNDLPILHEAARLYPGKRLTVLLLHNGSVIPRYGDVPHADVGDLMITMQLKFNLKFIVTEHEEKRDMIALHLTEWTRALAHRPYDFLDMDGPFFGFCPEITERTLARDARAGWVAFLTSVGIPNAAANAIAFRYPSVTSLLTAYATMTNTRDRVKMLSNVSANGTTVGPQYSAAIYNAFHAPHADDPVLQSYTPIRKK